MRSAILGAAALAAAACGHDLDLPPAPPSTPPDTRAEPALLGRLTGDYVLSVWDDARATESTAGSMRVMHLIDPAGREPERLLGDASFGQSQGMTAVGGGQRGELEPEPGLWCSTDRYVDATFDGARITGSVRGQDCGDAAAEVVTFSAEPLPGVAGFSSDIPHRVCPQSQPRPLRARRRCTFNASISGVYQGTATSCEGTVEPVQYGLGFNGARVSGFGWPWGSTSIDGDFDAFRFGGALQQTDVRTGEAVCAAFSLHQVGDEMRLVFDEFPLPEGGGPGGGMDVGVGLPLGGGYVFCGEPPEGCAGRHVELTRLAGGEIGDCSATSTTPPLYLRPIAVRDGDLRLLDVYAIPEGAAEPLEAWVANVGLVHAAGGAPAQPAFAPTGRSTRFVVGSACDDAPTDYELSATARGGVDGTTVLAAAELSCFTDRPPGATTAVEGSACDGSLYDEGGLVCASFDEDQDPNTPEPMRWLRPCFTSEQCSSPTQVCRLDGWSGNSYCLENRCGGDEATGALANGAAWTLCDASTGGRTIGASDGACLPLEEGARCVRFGWLPAGEACRPDASWGSEGLCEPAARCLPNAPSPAQPGACRCDADCPADGLVCDARLGRCAPRGTCTRLCDAGSAAASSPELAACPLGGACIPLSPSPGETHVLGRCPDPGLTLPGG